MPLKQIKLNKLSVLCYRDPSQRLLVEPFQRGKTMGQVVGHSRGCLDCPSIGSSRATSSETKPNERERTANSNGNSNNNKKNGTYIQCFLLAVQSDRVLGGLAILWLALFVVQGSDRCIFIFLLSEQRIHTENE